MRRNRKKQVHAKVVPSSVAGIFMLMIGLALLYWVMDSKCDVDGQEIRKYEQKLQSIEAEYAREEARWNEKNTPEKLEEAMLQHGIAMSYPSADQVVRMDTSGIPVAGQLSIARFKRSQSATERVVKTLPK
ncbi:MAG: hypothetical protein KBA18_07765 [Kiritimatiellae bacterium]|jgi:hypothetical protein|nr:hypothetical protein [Kiritimatiellia bacterium]NLF99475.1 hypothetical protein [Lentisphaerota bacterium]